MIMPHRSRATLLIAITASLSLLLTACGTTPISFYLVSPTPRTGLQKIGCDEYLIPVTKPVSNPTLQETIKVLLAADPVQYVQYGSGLITASAFKDGYFEVDDTIEPVAPSNSDPYRVYLKTVPGKGLTGACDTPRFKAQLTETIRTYAEKKNAPFSIALDGSNKKWECLGDESGRCQQ